MHHFVFHKILPQIFHKSYHEQVTHAFHSHIEGPKQPQNEHFATMGRNPVIGIVQNRSIWCTNQGPSCCKVTVLTTDPLCSLTNIYSRKKKEKNKQTAMQFSLCASCTLNPYCNLSPARRPNHIRLIYNCWERK